MSFATKITTLKLVMQESLFLSLPFSIFFYMCVCVCKYMFVYMYKYI